MKFKTRFSVQYHKNKSPHYDLRILSKDKKVLWSWAIPKARFPINKSEKLLAIQTPDHPPKYIDFQGRLGDGSKVNLVYIGHCIVNVDKPPIVHIRFLDLPKITIVLVLVNPDKGTYLMMLK